MSRKNNAKQVYNIARRDVSEQRKRIMMNSYVLTDRISAEGKAYSVISYFGRNETDTAYQKLRNLME